MNKEKNLETPLAELDLFGLPLIQKSVTDVLDTMHNPTSYSRSWSSSSVIEFVVDLAENEYMLMHETSMYMAMIVTKKTAKESGAWTPADAADVGNLTPVNNLFHSAIDRVQIQIGSSGHLVDITDYAYKAYLTTLLGYNENAKSTHLKTVGWEEEDDARRAMFIKEKKETVIHLRGKLFYDFEHQCRAIIGGSRVTIKINLKSPRFFFNAKEAKAPYATELHDVRLYVKRYKVADTKVKAHTKALQSANARYPMTTSCIKTYALRSGSLVANCDNIVTGKMPSRLFAVLVGKNNYTGSFLADPFQFKPHGVESISCYIDGVQYPNRPYTADFENGNAVDMYYSLFEALNQHDSEAVCDITMEDFMTDKCIFAFNFNPDLSSGYSLGGHWNPVKQGHMRLEIRFNKALTEDLHLIALCEFETLYEIDAFKNLNLSK